MIMARRRGLIREVEVKESIKVEHLIRRLELNPEEVVVLRKRDHEILIEDDIVESGDVVLLVPVSSGG
jgi:sulfur carrier protein ThiS